MTLKNVMEELLNKDIPRENLFTIEDDAQLKVMLPESATPEIMEILNRHGPTEIH